MDPKLAARLAQQQAKEQSGESAVEHAHRSSHDGGFAPRIDPALAERLARQQARLSSPDASGPPPTVASPVSAAAPALDAGRLDPTLLKLLAQRRERADRGDGAVCLASLARASRPQPVARGIVDTALAERLARQRAKADAAAEGGMEVEEVPMELGSEEFSEEEDEEVALAEAPMCTLGSFEQQLASLWCVARCYICQKDDLKAQVARTTLAP